LSFSTIPVAALGSLRPCDGKLNTYRPVRQVVRQVTRSHESDFETEISLERLIGFKHELVQVDF